MEAVFSGLGMLFLGRFIEKHFPALSFTRLIVLFKLYLFVRFSFKIKKKNNDKAHFVSN